MILIVPTLKFSSTVSGIAIQRIFKISVVETPVAEQYWLSMSYASWSKRPQKAVFMRYIERLSSSVR